MKCEMPNCHNDSVKSVSKNGVFHGIVNYEELSVCNSHDILEINECLEKLCNDKSFDMQICNPFVDVLAVKKTT